MAYSDFTLDAVRRRFRLTQHSADLFPGRQPVPAPAWLSQVLAKGMALSLSSEKARSEFIVSPILLTVRDMSENRIAIYSGQRLDVDPAEGLVGECDFLLAATDPLPAIQSPLISVIEAKRGDIDLGLGQCAAQLVGAQRFNQSDGTPVSALFGCVTTGEVWQFLRLQGSALTFDNRRIFFPNVELVLGTFASILAAVLAPPNPATPVLTDAAPNATAWQ